MKSKTALAAIIFVACVVLTGCRTHLAPLGNGLYVYNDKETSLKGVVNWEGEEIVPPYADQVISLHNMLVCRSPKNLEMLYDGNGIPVFFAECEWIDSQPGCIRCFSGGKMYLYVPDADLALGPLPPSRSRISHDTLYLERGGQVYRCRLAYPDIESLLYTEPLGWERSFAIMKPDREIVAGIARGDAYYAVRTVTQKEICAEENILFCRSAQSLAYGEDNGCVWTFFVPSAKGAPAAITEVPKKSWLIYDKTRCHDFLIIKRGKKWVITTLNGRPLKKLTRREWRTLRRALDIPRRIGGMHVAEIARMHLRP